MCRKQIVGSDCVNLDVRLIAGLGLWVTSDRQWPRLEPLTHYLFQAIMDLLTLVKIVCFCVCVCAVFCFTANKTNVLFW